MKSITINGTLNDSKILIGETLQNLHKYAPKDAIIITDKNVKRLYGDNFNTYRTIEIGIGEEIKNLSTVNEIIGQLINLEADRNSFIVGIGGGVVTDIAGYVASCFMRGIKFGFVSSTLLAQVDASVGGKNGVNYKGYKNLIGVINQPEFVICDTNMLQTLNEYEILNGMGEVVKHSLIADKDLFDYLWINYEKALKLEKDIINKLVYDSIRIKSNIVNKDEKESGERRKLNFGHTLGHAIEKNYSYGHGQSVSIGMVVAMKISLMKNYLSENDYYKCVGLLNKLKLPVECDFDNHLLIDAIKKDKKRDKDSLHFVMLKDIGNAIIEKITLKELEGILNDLC